MPSLVSSFTFEIRLWAHLESRKNAMPPVSRESDLLNCTSPPGTTACQDLRIRGWSTFRSCVSMVTMTPRWSLECIHASRGMSKVLRPLQFSVATPRLADLPMLNSSGASARSSGANSGISVASRGVGQRPMFTGRLCSWPVGRGVNICRCVIGVLVHTRLEP